MDREDIHQGEGTNLGEPKGNSKGIMRPGNWVVMAIFALLLGSIFWAYGQIKGPYSENEIKSAQAGATRFKQGELTVQKGKLLDVQRYFFTGTVYTVQGAQGKANLVSFVTAQETPAPGQDVEWVGTSNYASALTEIYPVDQTIDGEIISLERISPENNDQFYCVVHSLKDDKVQRFIVSAEQLATLKTLNSVQVTYRSPGESQVQLVKNDVKTAKGYIVDLWLTTKIHTLELERDFDFAKYPYYITVAPGPNAKYTWTFYLTKEQKDQVKVGNVLEIQYSSIFPNQIKVTSQAVDPSLLTVDPKNEDNTP